MTLEYYITGGDFANAGNISSAIKKTLKQIIGDAAVIRRTVVAIYEAEVNVVAHAYKGKITANLAPEYIEVIIEDEGPGIADIEQAMQEGYSTASDKVREMGFGAGMGLGNIKRNTDKFRITSIPGKGTKVYIKCLLA